MSAPIQLDPERFISFSLPQPFNLLGERQYVVGFGSVFLALDLRLHVRVEEANEGWEMLVEGEYGEAETMGEVGARWGRALGEVVLGDPEGLEGLRLRISFGAMNDICPAEVLLRSTVLAVAGVCAVKAHRQPQQQADCGELAGMSAETLRLMYPDEYVHPFRFFGESLVALTGGAHHVAGDGRTINVQQIVPPDSLLLVSRADAGGGKGVAAIDREIIAAVENLCAGAREVLSAAEFDMGRFFEFAGAGLSEVQTGSLYGLLRVREMINDYLEKLGQASFDHDVVGEMCDEESAILEDYFNFPPAPYGDIRRRAVETGALGAKLTFAFGGHPVLLILAPGRRHEVRQRLTSLSDNVHVLPVQFESAGLRDES